MYHDSELVSLETGDMTAGNIRVYLLDKDTYVRVRVRVREHQYAEVFAGH